MYTGTLLEFLNMGGGEIMLIMAVVLLLFGGKKLPELARGLGKGIREFKDASDGVKREIHRNINSVGITEEIDGMLSDNNNSRHHPSETALETQLYPQNEAKSAINLEKEVSATQAYSAPANTAPIQEVHATAGHPIEDNKIETDKTQL